MRSSDFLFESPFLEPGQLLKPAVMKGPYPSTENIKREFDFLGTLKIGDVDYNFWLSHSKNRAIVTTITTEHDLNDTSERQLICCELKFYKKVELPVKNQLQVSKVFTHEDHRQNWLAGALYIVLARYGYTVVSDLYQYNPGKGLWKVYQESQLLETTMFLSGIKE